MMLYTIIIQLTLSGAVIRAVVDHAWNDAVDIVRARLKEFNDQGDVVLVTASSLESALRQYPEYSPAFTAWMQNELPATVKADA